MKKNPKRGKEHASSLGHLKKSGKSATTHQGKGTIRQEVLFKAKPQDVYEALMDSKKHSSFTGSEAEISREVGGKFSVYGGGIRGKNLELVPGKTIVQEWLCETEGWPEGHYSRLQITLESAKQGTRLVMVHSGVPAASMKDIAKGWKDYYWEPMKKLLRG